MARMTTMNTIMRKREIRCIYLAPTFRIAPGSEIQERAREQAQADLDRQSSDHADVDRAEIALKQKQERLAEYERQQTHQNGGQQLPHEIPVADIAITAPQTVSRTMCIAPPAAPVKHQTVPQQSP